MTDTGENVPMGMTVYFLRHGQTAWNAEKRMQGQTNVPLNDVGRRQAREAGRRLPAIGVCLTSPLQRARETALLALGGEAHLQLGIATGGEPDPWPSADQREADKRKVAAGLAFEQQGPEAVHGGVSVGETGVRIGWG